MLACDDTTGWNGFLTEKKMWWNFKIKKHKEPDFSYILELNRWTEWQECAPEDKIRLFKKNFRWILRTNEDGICSTACELSMLTMCREMCCVFLQFYDHHFLISCPWKSELLFPQVLFPFQMENGGLWGGENLRQWQMRALSFSSSLFSLVLYEITMLPCYRNASCIPCWKKQDVADAHRFFQPAGPALRPSQ